MVSEGAPLCPSPPAPRWRFLALGISMGPQGLAFSIRVLVAMSRPRTRDDGLKLRARGLLTYTHYERTRARANTHHTC
eukprot:7663882-Pyramimonas_sp.AAC.1